MNRVRSLATQTPALVISVLALALSLGGGAYAATRVVSEHAPAAHHVSWHNISLRNGWKSSNSTYDTGNPRVSLQNGIVYLSGSMHGSGGSKTFAVLPKQYRPAHNLYITVYTFGDTSGTLYIGHNGIMNAYSPGICASQNTADCYTSLAAVSYPVNS